MTPLAALAAAGLVARLAAGAAPPPDVTVEGDVTYDAGSGALLVEHGAVLRRGAVTIRARSATYDPATGEVRASGGVLLTDPTRVIRADALRAVLGGDWEAQGVVAFVKDVPVDLGAVDTLEAARARGRNRLSFSGARLDGDPSGRFFLRDARLTLCDCPGGCPPSWEVTASKADVIPGKRAILTWPVLRITPRFLFVNADAIPQLRPIPVLVLPWLYLPLGDRQTGLLLPELHKTAATGWGISEPLFVTLGRSADLTLTADYAFGPSRPDPQTGAMVRGPGARLELRWAPAVRSEGRLELAWLHDLEREPLGEGGDRFAIRGGHVQRLREDTSLVAGLELYGDPLWVRDLVPDSLGRQVPYRRSAALVSTRGDALVVEGSAGYLQPLRPNGLGLFPGDRYASFGSSDRVANRWPGVAASLLPSAVGPLELSGRMGAVRYAPVSGAYDAAERPAVTRADARLQLAAPLLLGGALALSPYLLGAATGYAFEAARASAGAAWAIAGVTAATEVSRRFGALRHAIAPRLEWRAGTAALGERLPAAVYDALDRSGAAGLLSSGPPGAWQQLRAAVATRLSRGAVDLARLELGQDVDLRRGRFAETFASGGVAVGRLSLDAGARFLAVNGRGEADVPPPRIRSAFLDRFTELHAIASLSDARGDNLHAGFFGVGAGGSGPLVAGRDPLFDLRAAQVDATAGLSAGARVVLGAATLAYDVAFPGRPTYLGACNAGGTERRVDGWHATNHAASFVWDSPCRCFRILATAALNDCARSLADATFNASIDISRLVTGARPAPAPAP